MFVVIVTPNTSSQSGVSLWTLRPSALFFFLFFFFFLLLFFFFPPHSHLPFLNFLPPNPSCTNALYHTTAPNLHTFKFPFNETTRAASTMSSQGGPSFFCSRPDGSLTPLIALDDLPAGVTVRGVHRTLKPADTQGMISCGSTEPRAEPWTLDGTTVVVPGAIANDTELHDLLLKIVAETSVAPHLRQAIKEILFRDLAAPRSTGATTHGNTNNNAGRNAGHGHGAHANGKHVSDLHRIFPLVRTLTDTTSSQAFNAKKEYCSYWIRHGECDYAQQGMSSVDRFLRWTMGLTKSITGCLFKHQMPTDLDMLERLGLRDIPRWYREQHGVPSLLASNGNHREHLAAIDQSPKFQAVPPNGVTAGPAGSVGFGGPSGQTGPSGQAGPAGDVNGHANSNTGNKNRNGNQHGQGHGHGNNNINGTHNIHGHPRGGRYKSPRGAGFAAGKTRGTSTWNKAAVQDSVTPPSEDNGMTASGTPSSRTSNISGVSFPTSAKIDMMANPIASPPAEAEKASQHIMDKDDMPRKPKTLTERLRELTTEENFGGPYNDADYPDMSRKVSRRLYEYGLDGVKTKGAVKTKGTGFDPYAGLAKFETGNKASASASAAPITQLVAGSDPIDPNDPLINWGPIGEPVRRPAAFTDEFYAWVTFNSQTRNGFAAQFAHPDVRRQ